MVIINSGFRWNVISRFNSRVCIPELALFRLPKNIFTNSLSPIVFRVVEETPGQAQNERITKLSSSDFISTLGPQDLVTIVKHDSKKGTIGSFFYAAGLDLSLIHI